MPRESLDLDRDQLRFATLARQILIPNSDHEGSIGAARDEGGIRFLRDALVAQPMQQLEGVERRLRQTIGGNEPVTSVERLLHHALLFKYVGKSPVGEHVDQAVALADRVGKPGT